MTQQGSGFLLMSHRPQERKLKRSVLREKGEGHSSGRDKTPIMVLNPTEENISGFQSVPLMAAKPVNYL